MEPSDAHYVHGTSPAEQERLTRLNALLNVASLRAMSLRGGERILDVGSGLAQFTRALARAAGSAGVVIGVERDPEQLAEALRQSRTEGEAELLELRAGNAVDLPLSRDEWGSFDVVHARFVLEHVTDPAAVVRSMVRAARPGGRVILEDDDHETLRLSPPAPAALELWKAYFLSYERRGKDPYVGRRLVSLLHEAGARPRDNRCLFFGSCAGNSNFEAMIDNFVGIIETARKDMLAFGLADETTIEEGLAAFRSWRALPDAAMWYTTSWAEGIRQRLGEAFIAAAAAEPEPAADPDGLVTAPAAPVSSAPPPSVVKSRIAGRDEASLIRFLMDSAGGAQLDPGAGRRVPQDRHHDPAADRLSPVLRRPVERADAASRAQLLDEVR